MDQLIAVRLYFPLSARAKATRFWHRLGAPELGHLSVSEANAKEAPESSEH